MGKVGIGRILLVDDEQALLKICARALRSGGYDVVTCEHGEQAVRALEEGSFDAIVSDLEMPRMGGVGLLQAVRARDPDLPVILMTGHPTIETAALAVELGALRYLVKPFPPARLLDHVQEAVRLNRLARAKREALELLGGEVARAGDRMTLGLSFEGALETLWMAFQRVVRATDRTVYGYEALVRSREPQLPNPGALFDAAERLHRVSELGALIRRLVAGAAVTAPPNAVLFVNLHARDLLDDDLYDQSAPLSAFAGGTVLEVTERATLDGIPDSRARIEQLKELGYRIAIDDLGAGYAGLTSFTVLSPDIVKLDLSLIRDIDKYPVKRKIVSAMTDVAHELGMLIVAEGIETKGELNVVIDLGCDLLQGYHLGRPSAELS